MHISIQNSFRNVVSLFATFLYNLQKPFVRNFDLEAETSEQY